MSLQAEKARRAPVRAYAGAGLSALVGASLVGGLAALFRPEHPWVAFLVFAGCALGPMLALGWFAYVSRYTVTPDPHAEDGVEHRWYEQAASGAFHDLIMFGGMALVVVSVVQVDFSGSDALLLLLILGAVDVLVRYGVLKRRAVR